MLLAADLLIIFLLNLNLIKILVLRLIKSIDLVIF